jgi:hypothetical protein
MAPRSSSLPFVLSLLVAGCSATTKTHAPITARHVESPEIVAVAAAPSGRSIHPVLAHDGRAYVLTGAMASPPRFESSVAMQGGWTLRSNRHRIERPQSFTLVGPSGTCVGEGVARADVHVDYSGTTNAPLPGPTQSAIVVEGCAKLANATGLLLALDGSDPSATWEPLAHLDDEAAPTDRTFGEDEVWIHRYGLPGSDVDVVERTTIRYASPACLESEHRVILETEDGHTLANHPGFSVRGALRTRDGALVVLTGHDDPEALRVVPMSQTENEPVLDARLGLLADAGGASC